MVFLSIWIFVPLLTADTISREQRDGTLGLLFLTPLTPIGIVLGKSLIHAVRATTLFLAVLLILGVAFIASGSFREECRTSAMELLLITPLKVPQILRGRIRGVRGQFLPATVVLALAWLWLFKDASLYAVYGSTSDAIYQQVFGFVLPIFFISSFFLLPGIGLFFSLQRLHFIGAWLLTCTTGLLVPVLSCWWMNRSYVFSAATLFTMQFVVAFMSRILLQRNLARRNFALDSI
jgi:ABC-type Na+ efflux pump permease subunit